MQKKYVAPHVQVVAFELTPSTFLMASPTGGKNKNIDNGGSLGDDDDYDPTPISGYTAPPFEDVFID